MSILCGDTFFIFFYILKNQNNYSKSDLGLNKEKLLFNKSQFKKKQPPNVDGTCGQASTGTFALMYLTWLEGVCVVFVC